MICPNCGREYTGNQVFCPYCGAQQAAQSPQPSAPQNPQPGNYAYNAQGVPVPTRVQPMEPAGSYDMYQQQAAVPVYGVQQPRPNGFCISGFIFAMHSVLWAITIVGIYFSFFCDIPALVVSIIGLVQGKKNGDRCTGFGLAGIIISGVLIMIHLILLIILGGALFSVFRYL